MLILAIEVTESFRERFAAIDVRGYTLRYCPAFPPPRSSEGVASRGIAEAIHLEVRGSGGSNLMGTPLAPVGSP